MNQVILMGRLTKDPIERKSKSDVSVAKYTLAVPRRYKTDGKDTDFIDITSFGKTADFICKYLHKGSKVVVTGAVRDNVYAKEDGTKVYTLEIIGDDVEFAESKSADKSYQEQT